jgi:D-lactate dehydrogenase (cytochrome)
MFGELARYLYLSLCVACLTGPASVPVSKLPQLAYETKKDLAEVGLKSTIVGHVGDGNFHALILFKDDRELEIVKEAVHRMVHRAIALDGTCGSLPFGLSDALLQYV